MVFHCGLNCIIKKKLVQFNSTVDEIAVIILCDRCPSFLSVLFFTNISYHIGIRCCIYGSLLWHFMDVSHSSCILLAFGFLLLVIVANLDGKLSLHVGFLVKLGENFETAFTLFGRTIIILAHFKGLLKPFSALDLRNFPIF